MEKLNPVYINVDRSALPGHVVLSEKDWDKILKYFKETTIVTEFNEDDSVFVNHQQGACSDDCPICELGILFHERFENV